MKSGTIFDNVLITDSEEYASKFADETWGVTTVGENKMKEIADAEDKKKQDEEAAKMKGNADVPMFCSGAKAFVIFCFGLGFNRCASCYDL